MKILLTNGPQPEPAYSAFCKSDPLPHLSRSTSSFPNSCSFVQLVSVPPTGPGTGLYLQNAKTRKHLPSQHFLLQTLAIAHLNLKLPGKLDFGHSRRGGPYLQSEKNPDPMLTPSRPSFIASPNEYPCRPRNPRVDSSSFCSNLLDFPRFSPRRKKEFPPKPVGL